MTWNDGSQPASNQFVYITTYQYVGRTLRSQIDDGSIGGGGTSDFTELTNVPSGLVSSSAQITITESQISDLDHYDDSDVKTKLNTENVLSGSAANVKTFLNITESDISDLSHYSDSDVKTKLNIENVISSSAQVISGLEGQNVSVATLTAETYIVSSSVTHMTQSFSSGSTLFGDSPDDTHRITGSVSIAGNLLVNNAATITATTVTLPDQYMRKQFVKKADSISIPSTASFTAVTASAPSGMTATNEQDFVFFINGQYMEHDALTIKQAGSNFLLLVDTDSIGYSLEADDEIIAQGKFNS